MQHPPEPLRVTLVELEGTRGTDENMQLRLLLSRVTLVGLEGTRGTDENMQLRLLLSHDKVIKVLHFCLRNLQSSANIHETVAG